MKKLLLTAAIVATGFAFAEDAAKNTSAEAEAQVEEKDGAVEEYEVSGDRIRGVWMKPGWTHNIINLSDTEDLVTIMYATELLDKDRPDTYFEPVEE